MGSIKVQKYIALKRSIERTYPAFTEEENIMFRSTISGSRQCYKISTFQLFYHCCTNHPYYFKPYLRM